MLDDINAILRTQLTEKELIIYYLVERSGLSRRKLATILGISGEGVRLIHAQAKEKIELFAEAGIFQTKLN